MLVSCVITTYNQKKEYLIEAIASIISQDYPKIEIVISDDGSKEFDESFIKEYIENNNKGNIKTITIIRNATNTGTVSNINRALKRCEGEIVVPLASDDKLYNKRVISEIVERFITTNCNILVCSRMLCSRTLHEEIRLMPHPSYIPYIVKRMSSAAMQYQSVALEQSFEFASGSAMYYRRDFIMNQGLYDERYRLWEDGPLIARTTRNGIMIQYAYDIISISYRSGGISDKTSRSKKGKSQEIIQEDYKKLIINDYLSNSKLFSPIQKRIILGNLYRKTEFDKVGLLYMLKYPTSFINHLNVKAMKLFFRILWRFK